MLFTKLIVQIAVISLLSPENVEHEAGLLGDDINIQLIGCSLLEQGGLAHVHVLSQHGPGPPLKQARGGEAAGGRLSSPTAQELCCPSVSLSGGRVALRASCPSSAAWEPIRKLLLHPEEAEWDSRLPSVLSVLSPVYLLH